MQVPCLRVRNHVHVQLWRARDTADNERDELQLSATRGTSASLVGTPFPASERRHRDASRPACERSVMVATRATADDVRVTTVELPTAQVHLFRHAAAAATRSALMAIQLDASAAEEMNTQLLQLYERAGLFIGSCAFTLHGDPADRADDRFEGVPASLTCPGKPPLLDVLREVLHTNLVAVWRQLHPELHVVRGNFEIFTPGNGANMGWHQDGNVPGMFVVHFYLTPERGADASAAGTTGCADACDAAAAPACSPPPPPPLRMDWFEVALTPPPAEDEVGYDIFGLGGDDVSRAQACASNFLAFPYSHIVVFEDAALFHRTPLSARRHPAHNGGRGTAACHDPKRPPGRLIARATFYGCDRAGNELGLASPEGDTAWSDERAPRELPPGLAELLACALGDEASASHDVDDLLEHYVSASTAMTAWIDEVATRREATGSGTTRGRASSLAAADALPGTPARCDGLATS